MERCSKCNTESDFFVKYKIYEEEMGPTKQLCVLCDFAFDIRDYRLSEFLKDDFGKFPISDVSKNMIDARKARSLGQSPWQKPDNPII